MPADTLPLLLLTLLAAVGYLIYRISRLERLVDEITHPRRRPTGNGKVIPILKEQIEPGPFRTETEEPKPRPDRDRS